MLSKNEIKEIKKLHSGKFRRELQLFICEGERIVEECIASNPNCQVIATDKYRHAELSLGFNVNFVMDHVFAQISETKSPQGIMAVCQIPEPLTWEKIEKYDKILVCDGISDPGNLGTIIRTAESAGIEAVVLLNCADVYSGKVVRATMGAIFKLPILIANELQKQNRQIISLALENAENIFAMQSETRFALIVGSEAFGIKKEVLEMSDKIAKIPQKGGESLNAAVAAAIGMYHFGGLSQV